MGTAQDLRTPSHSSRKSKCSCRAACIWTTNIKGPSPVAGNDGAGSGVVCVNGAAAHKVGVGHLIIIAAFGWMPDEEAVAWKPKVVFVDDKNRQVDLGRTHEIGGQAHLKKVWG